MADVIGIAETVILGPGMSASRFHDGEVVFTIEDEDGHRVTCNASTFDHGRSYGLRKLREFMERAEHFSNLAERKAVEEDGA